MTHQSTQSAGNGLQLDVQLDFTDWSLNKKPIRASLVKGAAVVRKEARRIVSRRAVSLAGEFPGMQTGALKRAIGIVGKGSKGGWVKVGVRSIPNSVFYPAFLFYGSPKTNLAKRGNFMEQALDHRRDKVRDMIRASFQQAIEAR